MAVTFFMSFENALQYAIMNSEKSQNTQTNPREEGYKKIRTATLQWFDLKNRDQTVVYQSLERYTNQIIEDLKKKPNLTNRDFNTLINLICTRIAEHKNKTKQITENTAQLLQGLQTELKKGTASTEAKTTVVGKMTSIAIAASRLISNLAHGGNCDYFQFVDIVLEEGDRRQVISGTRYPLVGLCFWSKYERFPFTDSYAVAIEPSTNRMTMSTDCERFRFGSDNNRGTLATIRRKNLSLNESALACVGKRADGEGDPLEIDGHHKGVELRLKVLKKR